MKPLDYTLTFRAMDSYVQNFNDNKEQLGDKLRQSVIATAKEIIRIYGSFLMKANKIKPLDGDSLPPLLTNNVQLAKLTNSSSRTIQRHIQKLIEAGIIKEKQFRGTNASYKLWISDQILCVRCPKAVEMVAEALRQQKLGLTDFQLVTKNKTPFCLHTEIGNTNKNNIIIDGDKQDTPFQRRGLSSTDLKGSEHFLSGNTGKNKLNGNWDSTENELVCKPDTAPDAYQIGPFEQVFPELAAYLKKINQKNEPGTEDNIPDAAHQPCEQNLSGSTGKNKLNKIEEAGKNKLACKDETSEGVFGTKTRTKEVPRRAASLNFYAGKLWDLALNSLYKDRELTKWQHQKAVELIRKLYEPVGESKLAEVHEHYSNRIFWQVESNLRNKNFEFVQLPNRYFDTNNPTGFIGTKKRYLEELAKKHHLKQKLITAQQIRRYNNNLKKPAEKQKSLLEFYLQCKQRVEKLSNPVLTEKFLHSVLRPDQPTALYH